MLIDPSSYGGLLSLGAAFPFIAIVVLTMVIALCACLNSKDRRRHQTNETNGTRALPDASTKVLVTAKVGDGNTRQDTSAPDLVEDSTYDTIGNMTNENTVVRRESKSVTAIDAASPSGIHIKSGPLLPPRNSDALGLNGQLVLPSEEHHSVSAGNHHRNSVSSKGELLGLAQGWHPAIKTLASNSTMRIRKQRTRPDQTSPGSSRSALLSQHQAPGGLEKSDYSTVSVRLSSGGGLPSFTLALDDTYEDVDRPKVATNTTHVLSTADDLTDDTYEAVDQIKKSLQIPNAGHQETYSPSSSMHYERVDMLLTSPAIPAKSSIVSNGDYEPIPGSSGDSKLQLVHTNNVFSTVVPPASVTDPASGTTATPLYAVVDKSRKGEAEPKPVNRNISELYAKVSKPKKSAGGHQVMDSSPINIGPDCNDQSSSPGITQLMPNDQCNLQESKQSESGYDSIDLSMPSSSNTSSNYDNVSAGELVSKEPMYEEMATVVSKVDMSHVDSN